MPATWKKIIVSGSNAELNSLNVTTNVTASLFSGSFVGDGTGLTGVSSFTVSGDTNNRVITADGSGNGVGEENLTFDGTTLNLTGTGSISGDLTVGGNLFVNGDLTNINTTNLNIEDQFILLNSGSTEVSDTGIIFGGVGNNPTGGAVFYYNKDEARLAYVPSGYNYSATAVTPEAYVPVVYDVTGASHTPEDKVGNIKIESGEAFIYV